MRCIKQTIQMIRLSPVIGLKSYWCQISTQALHPFRSTFLDVFCPKLFLILRWKTCVILIKMHKDLDKARKFDCWKITFIEHKRWSEVITSIIWPNLKLMSTLSLEWIYIKDIEKYSLIILLSPEWFKLETKMTLFSFKFCFPPHLWMWREVTSALI